MHFAPTERNVENLKKEAIDEEKIFITGNTVIDALLQVADKPYEFFEPVLKNMDFENKRVNVSRQNFNQCLIRNNH